MEDTSLCCYNFELFYSYRSDSDDDEDTRQWPIKHNEDILSLACSNASRSLATSSYDGDIWVWSLETAHPLCKLNAFEGVKPQTGSRMLSVSRETSFHTTAGTSVYSSSTRQDDAEGSNADELADDVAGMSVGSDNDNEDDEANEVKSKSLLLPAIDVSRRTSLVDQKRANNLKEESQTFFTESIGPGMRENHRKEENSNREKSGKKDKDKDAGPQRESSYCLGAKNKEDYTRKHEASVDKVSHLYRITVLFMSA